MLGRGETHPAEGYYLALALAFVGRFAGGVAGRFAAAANLKDAPDTPDLR